MHSTASPAASDSFERLRWDVICERFPDRWVVLAEIDWLNDTDFEFGTAAVIAHHGRRKDASPDVVAARARNLEVGCFWTGDVRSPIPRLTLP
jgi:hypothetical protein